MNRLSSISLITLALIGAACTDPAPSSTAMTATQSTDSTSQAHAQTSASIPKISVQLYSVKEDLKADFKQTLTQIAAMGFSGVEFAGDFGPYADDPQGLKTYLESLGLQASGAHVRLKHFNADNFASSVAFYQTLGVDSVIVPWDERANDPEKINELVSDLNKLNKQLKAEGLRFGYHNHDEEFETYQQHTFWDQIARNTTDDFVMQMDVGWVAYAEKNPVLYINRYPNRTQTTHFKAKLPKSFVATEEFAGKRAIIGEDMTDWPAVINSNIAVGGTQWFVVEQEEYPDGLTPLEAVALSKKGLDRIIEKL
ncbi:sugar phosphate isomerase/epimerase [Shewanella sp.]|nr:sugar phosphate isomerase/epimerase [Shewanella sp.]